MSRVGSHSWPLEDDVGSEIEELRAGALRYVLVATAALAVYVHFGLSAFANRVDAASSGSCGVIAAVALAYWFSPLVVVAGVLLDWRASVALATVAIFSFFDTWNSFQGPLIYLNTMEKYTLPVGLTFFHDQYMGTPWNQMMAASLLVMIPCLVVFFFAQRTFIQGAVLTGLKG